MQTPFDEQDKKLEYLERKYPDLPLIALDHVPAAIADSPKEVKQFVRTWMAADDYASQLFERIVKLRETYGSELPVHAREPVPGLSFVHGTFKDVARSYSSVFLHNIEKQLEAGQTVSCEALTEAFLEASAQICAFQEALAEGHTNPTRLFSATVRSDLDPFESLES